MIRNLKTVARSLGAIAILAATVGCPADESKSPSQQLQSPTAPLAGLQITINASRSRLEVGDDTKTSLIQVEVLRTVDWTPVANGTDATFTATLGAIDSPSGGREVTIDLINGRGSITLFPGTTSGTARITVEVLGATASVNVTIDPDPTGGVPPEPAPTASTLDLVCAPTVVGKDDPSPVSITCQATVGGSDGEPLQGAGVYMTTDAGIGTFDSSGTFAGSTQTTNSAGQVSDTLTIPTDELDPFSSFQIIAHLLIEGGEKLDSVTITVQEGAAPLVATTVTLSATSSTTISEDAGVQTVDFEALVRDQFTDPLDGVIVDFRFGANGGPGGFAPSSEETGAGGTNADATGVASTTLTASEAEIEAFLFDQFTVLADVVTTGGTITSNGVVITIARSPDPGLSASFTASDTTPCHDALDGDSVVEFTDTSTGSILTWEWDLDGDGFTDDSNVADPTFDYDGFAADVDVNVTLIVSDGVASDSFSMIITPTDCTP